MQNVNRDCDVAEYSVYKYLNKMIEQRLFDVIFRKYGRTRTVP